MSTNIIQQFLSKSGEYRYYKIGDIVFNEADSFSGLYYVLEGEVKIVKRGKEKNVLIWMAKAGELIGLQSFFLDTQKYSYSSVVTSDTAHLGFIPENVYSGLLDSNPAFKFDMSMELCKRIDYAEDRLKSFFKKSTKERFAEALIQFAEKGMSSGSKLQYKIARSQLDNLADYVGTSLEYILKLTREFKRKRLISDESKDYISISDIDRLIQISGGGLMPT